MFLCLSIIFFSIHLFHYAFVAFLWASIMNLVCFHDASSVFSMHPMCFNYVSIMFLLTPIFNLSSVLPL